MAKKKVVEPVIPKFKSLDEAVVASAGGEVQFGDIRCAHGKDVWHFSWMPLVEARQVGGIFARRETRAMAMVV